MLSSRVPAASGLTGQPTEQRRALGPLATAIFQLRRSVGQLRSVRRRCGEPDTRAELGEVEQRLSAAASGLVQRLVADTTELSPGPCAECRAPTPWVHHGDGTRSGRLRPARFCGEDCWRAHTRRMSRSAESAEPCAG